MFVLGCNKTKRNSIKLESEISLVPKATRKYQDIRGSLVTQIENVFKNPRKLFDYFPSSHEWSA